MTPVVMYIQSSDVNSHTPAQILAPLAGKFTAITTYQAGNYAAVAALFSAALAAGYDTYLWVSPGYCWSGMPSEWNSRNIWPDYPDDWTAMHLSACRAGLLTYWTGIAQNYVDAGLLTGIQLDLIRYPLCCIYWYPPQSASDITTVVQSFRTWCNARGLNLVASVKQGNNITCGGGPIPEFESAGQNWPDWIDGGYIDYALIMSYILNYHDDPNITWANQPTTPESLAHQRPILDPAGAGGTYSPPPDWDDWLRELQYCDEWPYPETPSIFDWGRVDDAGRWSWVPYLEEEPPTVPILRISGTELRVSGAVVRVG